MKTSIHFRAAFLLLLFIVPVGLMAQYKSRTDNYHFVFISLSGGYSSFADNISEVSAYGGFGAAAGFGYEFRHEGFWMNVGGQFRLHNSGANVDEYVLSLEGLDTQAERKPVTLQYRFHQHDEHHLTSIDIPVMFGYYYQGFYLGAGGKASIAMSSVMNTQGDFDLRYIYPQYVDMPTPPADNSVFSSSSKVNLNVGGSLIGEVGYDILATQRTRGNVCNILKIGFYFEYGINSIVSNAVGTPRISFPYTNENGETIATRPEVKPYYAAEMTNARVVPYYLGAKITYMFGGSRTGATGTWHRGCQCYD